MLPVVFVVVVVTLGLMVVVWWEPIRAKTIATIAVAKAMVPRTDKKQHAGEQKWAPTADDLTKEKMPLVKTSGADLLLIDMARAD